MASSNDLPFLLRLLDDPSPVVRQELARAFQRLGPALEDMLLALPEPPDAEQHRQIKELLQEQTRADFRASWILWYLLRDDKERLETALSLFAVYLRTDPQQPELGPLLDALAADFRAWDAQQEQPGDSLDLARFLFEDVGYRGVQENYYAPENSNVVHVIQTKQGLPISLSCIYLLVGHRLNMSVGGCNWPGHFLALTFARNNLYVVDCFNGGKATIEEDFLKKQGPSRKVAANLLHHEASAEVIVQRVLSNLANAYKRQNDTANQLLMAELLEIHERMVEGAAHN